jgi:hypothetical protein
MFIKLSQKIVKMIHWVKLACSTDDARPVLQGINFRDGLMEATNGFRIHQWSFNGAEKEVEDEIDAAAILQLGTIANGVYLVNLYGVVVELEPVKELFPNTAVKQGRIYRYKYDYTIIDDKGTDSLDVACASINPLYLKDALSAPVKYPNAAFIEIGSMVIVEYPKYVLKSGGLAKAIIMPMTSKRTAGTRLGMIGDTRDFDELKREEK